jgi:thiamine kinase-like enzyme
MVTQYLGASTFSAADVRAEAGRVATLLARFHREMAPRITGAAFLFWVFHVIRDYARTLEAGGSRWRDRLPGLLAASDELERAQTAMPIIFGHNDLLPANILDDGERLWLIDFEYAGFNTAMFDLAGAASNAEMDADASMAFVEAYLGSAADDGFARAFSAMQAASLLREAMWGMVSELHLAAPGVDYVAYAGENLAKFEAALARHRETYGR